MRALGGIWGGSHQKGQYLSLVLASRTSDSNPRNSELEIFFLTSPQPLTTSTQMHTKLWPSLLLLAANHTLMHGGQFTVVRRALGKPVVF